MSDIGEICSRIVVFARREDSVQDAAALLREHHVGCVVVCDERQERRIPVGMLTDRDIVVGVVAKSLDASALTVGEVMAAEIATVLDTTAVDTALDLMRTRGVRRLPVVDDAGALVGVVSMDDIVAWLAETLTAAAGVIERGQRREAVTRQV